MPMSAHLCECGCGQPTQLANKTRATRGYVMGQPIRLLHGHNARGERNPAWKGGRRASADGYVLVCDMAGGVRREHTIIAERVLGRALPAGVIVHHVDENRSRNANSNLVILYRADHSELHRKMRVRALGGNPWTDRVCSTCKAPQNSAQFYASTSENGVVVFEKRCKGCSREHSRQRRLRRAA